MSEQLGAETVADRPMGRQRLLFGVIEGASLEALLTALSTHAGEA